MTRRGTPVKESVKKTRTRGTREETEQIVVDSTLRLLEKNGILAGLTIRDVVRESHVNQGQVYQYFGDRRGLLREAIRRKVSSDMPDMSVHFRLPFRQRRQRMWRWALGNAPLIQLQALLAVEGVTDVPMFPSFDDAVDRVRRDQSSGEVDPSLDPVLTHLMTTSMYLGYALFRRVMATRSQIALTDLDARAEVFFLEVIDRLGPWKADTDDTAAGPQ